MLSDEERRKQYKYRELPPDQRTVDIYHNGQNPNMSRWSAIEAQKQRETPLWVKEAQQREAEQLAQQQSPELTSLKKTFEAMRSQAPTQQQSQQQGQQSQQQGQQSQQPQQTQQPPQQTLPPKSYKELFGLPATEPPRQQEPQHYERPQSQHGSNYQDLFKQARQRYQARQQQDHDHEW